MDDNHFLIEWLAYHYHVLPLRHLIVAVDPRAKTSSQEIFDRWSGLIDITVWNDTHIFEDDFDRTAAAEKGDELMALHRTRQVVLYEKCMKKFKADGHHWVVLLDTDEFLVVQTSNFYEQEQISRPGSILKYLKEHASTNITPPCLLRLPRRRYGTRESLAKIQDRHVPKGFNSSDFLTLRWRYYGMNEDRNREVLIKSMIDVSRVEWNDLYTKPLKKYAVHIPLDICGSGDRVIRMSYTESVLAVSHFPGTWEQYSFREDAREGTKAFVMKNDEVRR
jgi:hypothetical protein